MDANFCVSLRLPYKKYPASHGNGFYYVAVLPVSIALPLANSPRSKRFEAIIDSGATRCQFQAAIGRAMGFDIESGEAEETLGINGVNRIYMHDISLYLPGGVVATRAAFSYELPVPGLLGMEGFFEHFQVIFDPVARQVELERIHQS